jgi:hypothetical protein
VQTAEKPLNCPAVGCVTTILASANTLPPPTGTSAVVPSTVPVALPLEELGALVGADELGVLDGVPLAESPLPLQAASSGTLTPAIPATAAPRSTVRRSRGVSIARLSSAELSSLIELVLQGCSPK